VLLLKVPSGGRDSNSLKVFFNKSTKAMPYISKQYRTNSFVNILRSYIAQVPLANTHDRVIDLAPWPKEIGEKGIVRFVENGRAEAEVMTKKVCKPDVLVLATGYTQSFPFLDSTYPTPNQANMRTVWKEGDSTVGFIGFLRPSFGKNIPSRIRIIRTNARQELSRHLPSSRLNSGSSTS
jgi:dimethylaniline monooxygenase (N-oxide forming)